MGGYAEHVFRSGRDLSILIATSYILLLIVHTTPYTLHTAYLVRSTFYIYTLIVRIVHTEYSKYLVVHSTYGSTYLVENINSTEYIVHRT